MYHYLHAPKSSILIFYSDVDMSTVVAENVFAAQKIDVRMGTRMTRMGRIHAD